MAAETEALKAGKLHLLSTGEWFVHCRWCETETRLEAQNEEEAFAMLEEWRLYWDVWQADWSCPACCFAWDFPEPTTTETAETAATDAAGSAGQLVDAAATSFDALQLEVVALKAEIVELKDEVGMLRWKTPYQYVAYDARAAAREDDEILADVLEMLQEEVRRLAVPADTRDAADITVPDEQEETSHNC